LRYGKVLQENGWLEAKKIVLIITTLDWYAQLRCVVPIL